MPELLHYATPVRQKGLPVAVRVVLALFLLTVVTPILCVGLGMLAFAWFSSNGH